MTRKEQVKILDDKIKANKIQYDLDRINTEITSYSSGDLPKYEYLTKKDLGYKPDAFEQAKFEYSPLGKVFTDGLAKEDKSRKIGLFERLKNIEDNLVEVADNDNKVDIFRIIKDIKDKGIKIDNDDEAVIEIRERIKELIDNGVKVNNFDEMTEEIIEHIQNFRKQAIDVKINENKINDLINKTFDIKDKKDKEYKKYIYIDSEIDKFLEKYRYKNISITYDKNKFSAEEINESLIKLQNDVIKLNQFIKDYNKFMNNAKRFEDYKAKKDSGAVTKNQKEMKEYIKKLKYIVDLFNPQAGSGINKKGKGLKLLTNQQMLNRLPILLPQIQAGNNSIKLKNEIRQILYSLYRSKVLTKTVYNNLIKVI